MANKLNLSLASRSLDALAAAAVVVLAAAVVWGMVNRGDFRTRPKGLGGNPPPSVQRHAVKPPREPVSLEGAPTVGKVSAPVAVIEYADFQCPFCAAFVHDTLPVLQADYIDSGRLILAFRNMPLPIHSLATVAAEGAECASVQDHFWPMHDSLFAAQNTLNDGTVNSLANTLRLDMKAFKGCMQGEGPSRTRADLALGKEWGVSATPTFFFGLVQPNHRVKVTAVLEGNQRLDVFRKTVDRLLNPGTADQ
jgi:protein-disulfide isomerase